MTNYRYPIDRAYSKKVNLIELNIFDENCQESFYISNLVNKAVELFNLKSTCFKLKKLNFEIFKKDFINLKIQKNHHNSLLEHDHLISKVLKKNKKIIYLYYGCSGKAKHRLPPLKWFKNFEYILLKNNYLLIYVGGSGEANLEDIITSNQSTNFEFINRFSISEWSIIISNSKYDIPLLSFDGGFSHIFGVHSDRIFQIFCSSNNLKWRNKSSNCGVYACLDNGSPYYKPYKFKVPDKCKLSDHAWENTNERFVFEKFEKWFNKI